MHYIYIYIYKSIYKYILNIDLYTSFNLYIIYIKISIYILNKIHTKIHTY